MKPVETFLGPATLHSASVNKTKAKWRLSFSDLGRAPAGMQILKASRIAASQEPNLWRFRIEGIRDQSPASLLAPTPEDALRAYLQFPQQGKHIA